MFNWNKINYLFFTILIFFIFFCAGLSAQKSAFIRDAFLDGNAYLKLPESDKVMYIMGIIDGFKLAPFFGAEDEDLKWIHNCTPGMSNYQIKAIIDKFLQDNPHKWHEQMHILIHQALREACSKK